jgi:hypothetical protein
MRQHAEVGSLWIALYDLQFASGFQAIAIAGESTGWTGRAKWNYALNGQGVAPPLIVVNGTNGAVAYPRNVMTSRLCTLASSDINFGVP